ncbi:hypothetical protein AC249_AIPGENE12538 [Exaiptasia diaphana]|nr:hypothetical protein AC249_AIPGENE12538 [Exaiptasia diaphana]
MLFHFNILRDFFIISLTNEIVKFMMKDDNFKNATEGKQVIDLRFSGDGRKTTKKMGSVMTTFSLPSEKNRSPDTEYCISIYDGKESRDILSTFIKDVFKEMEEIRLKGISLDDKVTLKIDWLLCADWKFMAILLGINSPSSEYFCLWCKCCKKLIRDFSIADWKITRTYENCVERALETFTGNRKGVQAIPLINVNFEKVIPDTLHLLLRIRGKLLNQDVIPYIHVLVYHIPQFLEKYQTLHHFNCQTVEKIMEKENRKLFARLENLERIKRKYTSRKANN